MKCSAQYSLKLWSTDETRGRKGLLMMIEGVGNIVPASVCSSWLQWETGQTAAARDGCKYGSRWSPAASLQHCSTGHCREYNPSWDGKWRLELGCSSQYRGYSERGDTERNIYSLQCVPKITGIIDEMAIIPPLKSIRN